MSLPKSYGIAAGWPKGPGQVYSTPGALVLSPLTAVAGQPYSGTFTGKSAGSTVIALSSDGTQLLVSGTTVSGVFSLLGSPTIYLVEYPVYGSPRTSAQAFSVAAPTAPGQTIGGVEVGSAGTGFYSGFILSGGDDFDGSAPDVSSPAAPKGKYFPTRIFSQVGGSQFPNRGGNPGSSLQNMHVTDPGYTGWLDSNKGVPVGFDNVRVASSILTIQGRSATAGEKLHMRDPAVNVIATAELNSAGAMVFTPGPTGSPCIVEARVRLLPPPNGPRGLIGAFWTYSVAPVASTATKDEWDIIEYYVLQATSNKHTWAGGSTTDGGANVQDYTNSWIYDGNWHTLTAIGDKSSLKMYIDGTLRHTKTLDANSANRPMSIMFQMFAATQAGVTFTESDWTNLGTGPTGGARTEYDWYRVWRPATAAHYKPLATVPDLSIAYAGSGTIVVPSALSLWGDASVTEYIEFVPSETNSPGVTLTSSFTQFPTGVTYNSGTRTITVDFSAQAGYAGRMDGVIYAYKVDGSTCEPARFTVYRGPNPSTLILRPGVGVAYSHDLYFDCDVGQLTPKVLNISGSVPAGLGRSGTLVTGTPTNTTPQDLTVGVTNNVGQAVSKLITIAPTLVTSLITDTFTDTIGTNLSAHTTDTGQAWAYHPVNTGIWLIDGTEVYAQTATALAYVTSAPTSADYYVESDFSYITAAGRNVGVVGRLDPVANTFWCLRYSTNTWELVKFVNGTPTVIDSGGPAFTTGNVYTARLSLIGPLVRGYINGSLFFTANDTTILDAGYVGIRGGLASTPTTGINLQNFSMVV